MVPRARVAAIAFTVVGLGLACQSQSASNTRQSAAALDALVADECTDDGCCACATQPADSDDPERYDDGLARDEIDAIDDEETLDDEYPASCDAGDEPAEADTPEAAPLDTALRALSSGPPDGIGKNNDGWYGPLPGKPPTGPWPSLIDMLKQCPIGGKMPYCAPNMPGVRCERFTFNCVDFSNALCTCFNNALAIYGLASDISIFNGGAKKCCRIRDNKEGDGHSTLYVCSAENKSCCIVDGQAHTGKGGGARCCFDWTPGTKPTTPDRCAQSLCPAGTYSCGDGAYDIENGCPTGNGGGSDRICQSLFKQSTGLDVNNPSPTCDDTTCQTTCNRFKPEVCGGPADGSVTGKCSGGKCACTAVNSAKVNCAVTGTGSSPSCNCTCCCFNPNHGAFGYFKQPLGTNADCKAACGTNNFPADPASCNK